MKKFLLHINKFLVILAITFAISGLFSPQPVDAACGIGSGAAFLECFIAIPGNIASTIILPLASLITYLSGVILNYVVYFTVVDMKTNIGNVGIDLAWRTIRDIANIGFIFTLLYAAIKTILGTGDETRGLIVKVIVVAVLINFSLFFTKVVIDASNVLAVTFYDAIAPGSLQNGLNPDRGIANTLMEPLKIQSLWHGENIAIGNGTLRVTVGVMGTIVSLIAAFVFFAIAILFVIRFVALILVLVLSPLAFLGWALPELKNLSSKWWDTLLHQSFFAPIYFLLTWVVIVISRDLLKSQGTMVSAVGGIVQPDGSVLANPAAISVLVNFIIMIVLLIASLIIAKDWASKVPGGMNKLTGWVMGAAGGTTLGMAGRFGRGTIGRTGAAISESNTIKNMLARGGAAGGAARMAMWAGNKAGTSSWDLRGSGLGNQLGAGKAKKGGFKADQKERLKNAAQRAKSLTPTTEDRANAQRRITMFEEQERKAMEKTGYRDDSLREAESALNRAKILQFGERETDMDVQERITAAQRHFDEEQDRDRTERLRYSLGNRGVAKAAEARQRAEQEMATLDTRSKDYAERQSQPLITMPKIPAFAAKRIQALGKANEVVDKINENILSKGVGGYTGEKLKQLGIKAEARGWGRMGRFISTIGRTTSLRKEEREEIAKKAKNADATLKKLKDDDIKEKIKEMIEKEEPTKEEEKTEESKPKPSTA